MFERRTPRIQTQRAALSAIIDNSTVTRFRSAPPDPCLMREGDAIQAKYKMDSLRVLGSVGEPIKP